MEKKETKEQLITSIESLKKAYTEFFIILTLVRHCREKKENRSTHGPSESNRQVIKLEDRRKLIELSKDQKVLLPKFEVEMLLDLQNLIRCELIDEGFILSEPYSYGKIGQKQRDEKKNFVWREIYIYCKKDEISLNIKLILNLKNLAVEIMCYSQEETQKNLENRYFYKERTTDFLKLHEFAGKVVDKVCLQWKKIQNQRVLESKNYLSKVRVKTSSS